MAGAILALIGGIIGYLIRDAQHRREIGVKMIEIAARLLAAEPEPGTKALRSWAVNILGLYSPKEVPFGAEAKEELRDKPLPIIGEAVGTAAGGASTSYRPRGLGAHGESGEIFEPVPVPPQDNKPPA